MPTYQYECDACGHSLEVLQSMTDKRLRKCPQCGKLKLHRLIGSGGGIIFKVICADARAARNTNAGAAMIRMWRFPFRAILPGHLRRVLRLRRRSPERARQPA